MFHPLRRGCCLAFAASAVTVFAAEPGPGVAGVRLEPLRVCGPFKEPGFGNALRAFRHDHGPEAGVLAAGKGAPDLTKIHLSPAAGRNDDGRREWVARPDWVDGYRHLLPGGPPPARGETFYLFRTIHAEQAATLTLRVYAEDFVAAWLNGRRIGEALRNYGPHHYPVPLVVPLPLEQGENQLLVKITCLFGTHGFAFALDGVTPGNSLRPLDWSPEILRGEGSNFHSFHRPMWQEDPSAGEGAAADPVADARKLLESLRFDVVMTPMFDPPESKMRKLLDETVASSAGGRAYLESLLSLRAKVEKALARQTDGAPESAAAVVAAADSVRQHWQRAARAVGPLLFLRCPPFDVNAIAPYSAAGAAPASLCVLDPARLGEPPRVIFHEPQTAIFDFNLSFDARTVFFSARRPGVQGGWHIYQIGVDGSGLRQITSGDCSDISPVELPDGRVMFVSDRADTWVQCQAQKAGLLYSCLPDGTAVRRLSANIDSDHSPQVMDDGRVLFTRWDYGVEKNVFARHALWTMNPDGTGLRLFFGNTIEDPAGFWEARQVPGRPEVACVFGPHHSFHAGMAGLVWDRLGPEAPRGEGFRFLTNEIPCYCDTTFPQGYQDLFPLNERLFLVSYGGDGGGKNRLYLLDDRGNRRCLAEAGGGLGIWNPVALRPRPVPPVIPPQAEVPEWVRRDPEETNRNPDEGLTADLFVQDVLRGLEPEVKRDEVAAIQIVEQVQKSRCMAGGEAWGHTPIIGRGTVHVRRLVGEVPVEADGSAHFTVPALRSISFNVLDRQGRTLMRMGSDMVAMPGERQGCIGCHENRGGGIAPAPGAGYGLAMARPPSVPRRPDWGTGGLIDYQKVIQPVWDRHCLPCHGGPLPAAGIDMSGDRTRFFCESYDNLVERDLVDWHQPFAGDHGETAPRSVGSVVSRLSAILDDTTHLEHEIPGEDKRRVYTWMDANVPYYSTYTYSVVRGIGARDSWECDAEGTTRNPGGWMQAGLRPVFERRCLECHRREVHNQGFWGWGGGPMDRMVGVSSKLWTDRGLTAHMFPQRYPMSALLGPELRINLTRPAHSSMLQAPLAKEAGGWGLCRGADGSPVFRDHRDPDYRRMLLAIEIGKARLYQQPREDMDAAHVAAVKPGLLPQAVLDDALASWRPAAGGQLSAGMRVLHALPAGCRNLALEAQADSPDGVPLDGVAPRVSENGATDGNPATLWDELDGRAPYRLRLTFPEPVTVSALSLTGWAHHDFAPRGFRILADGREVGRVASAVYQENFLALAIPRVTCRSLELVIDDAYGGSPAIRELGVHDP